ncbi:hypothetical protein ACEQ6C_37920, partial [Rhizobium ruizarguesonis]
MKKSRLLTTITSMFLAAAVVFSGGVFSSKAAEKSDYRELLGKLGNGDGEIVAIYKQDKDGGLKQLSKADIEELVEKKDKVERAKKAKAISEAITSNSEINPLWIIIRSCREYEYRERGNDDEAVIWDQQQKGSDVIYNSTSSTIKRDFSYEITAELETNRSLSSSFEDAIEAEIGVTIRDRRTIRDTVRDISIKPGYSSWIEVAPYSYNTWGTMYTWLHELYDDNLDPRVTLDTVDELDVYIPYNYGLIMIK